MKKILFLVTLGALMVGCSESLPVQPVSIETSVVDTIPPPSDCFVMTDEGIVYIPCDRRTLLIYHE